MFPLFQRMQQVVDAPPPAPPTPDKPCFWQPRLGLDIRPLVWSLRNRPEEWSLDSPPAYWIQHKPSKHYFWIRSGIYGGLFAHHLSDRRTSCSCVTMRATRQGRFTLPQKIVFHAAYRHWLNNYHAAQTLKAAQETNEQFYGHFVRDEKKETPKVEQEKPQAPRGRSDIETFVWADRHTLAA